MRIGVIGAGAIGGTIAALLHRGGHRVEVTARGQHLEAIRAGGLRLRGGFGEHLARVAASTALTSAPELAVLSVKAADAPAALHHNAGALRGIPLVVVQNGLDGLRTAASAVPDARLVGGLSLVAASHLEPGEVTVTAALPTFLGRAPDGDADAVRIAARLLGAVMPMGTVADLVGAQWTKLLINHVNALPAITGLAVQEVIADAGLRRILTASMRESVRVAHRAGIRFAPLGGLDDRLLTLLGAAPLAIGGLLPRRMASRMGPVPNPGSTLQSIRRGQRSEIDALNGAIVRVARERGLLAPVNASLTALVHQVEATGEFVAPAEVRARVRLAPFSAPLR